MYLFSYKNKFEKYINNNSHNCNSDKNNINTLLE